MIDQRQFFMFPTSLLKKLMLKMERNVCYLKLQKNHSRTQSEIGSVLSEVKNELEAKTDDEQRKRSGWYLIRLRYCN